MSAILSATQMLIDWARSPTFPFVRSDDGDEPMLGTPTGLGPILADELERLQRFEAAWRKLKATIIEHENGGAWLYQIPHVMEAIDPEGGERCGHELPGGKACNLPAGHGELHEVLESGVTWPEPD